MNQIDIRTFLQHQPLFQQLSEAQREALVPAITALRDAADLKFNQLTDICGADYPDRAERFEIVIHLLSMTHNLRLRVKISTDGRAPVPSLTDLYPNAGWYERETWDFFGIVFDGHPALTRIAMPDDWPGHPQRKDYPLGGIPVEYKGATIPPPDQRRSYN